MKANELTIGDYVSYKEKIHKIETLGKIECFLTGDKLVELKEIIPIPITAEILEKNGFELSFESPRRSCWRFMLSKTYDKDICVFVDIHTKYVNIYYNPFDDIIEPIDISIKNCCVHELQHALRLFGVDKEIQL